MNFLTTGQYQENKVEPEEIEEASKLLGLGSPPKTETNSKDTSINEVSPEFIESVSDRQNRESGK